MSTRQKHNLIFSLTLYFCYVALLLFIMFKHQAENNSQELSTKRRKKDIKKYSLDSDEEDDDVSNDNVLDENDIEGEEEGDDRDTGEERFTAFNMREEMEEGHFDKDGHFIWDNEKNVRDNWLDNIDWQKIKPDGTAGKKSKEEKTLGEESSDESDDEHPMQEIEVYREIITYMKPRESINQSLRRLGGGGKKLTTLERLKLKKQGLTDTNSSVTELTELANNLLSKTGNMDVYQETHETISAKIKAYDNKNKPKAAKGGDLDMYADDFDAKEKEKLNVDGTVEKSESSSFVSEKPKELLWEYKESAGEEAEIKGPYTSEKMLEFSEAGKLKGVLVRKCAEGGQFYSGERIDFDLYL